MKLNPTQRAAIFEHLSKSGKIKPSIPHVPQAGTKIPQALMPPQLPGGPPMPANQTNPDMIGNPRVQKFQKMKKMMGMG